MTLADRSLPAPIAPATPTVHLAAGVHEFQLEVTDSDGATHQDTVSVGVAPETICNDGIDNDGDGLTDYPDDPGCAHFFAAKEDPQCDDAVDNDGDLLVDLADPHCTSASDDTEAGGGSCGMGVELGLLLPLVAAARRRAKRMRRKGRGAA